MRTLLDALTRRRRALLFLSWGATLLVLIRLGGYRAFLRPEFGVLLKAAYLILLLLFVAELSRRREAPLHGLQLLSPAILLLPLLFLLNAQGVKLDSYAFEKRSVGTPRVAAQEASPDRQVAHSPGSDARSSPSSTPGPDSAGQFTPAAAPGGAAPDASSDREAANAPRPDTRNSPPSASGPSAAGRRAPAAEPPKGSHGVAVTLLDLYRSPKQYEGKMVSLVGMTNQNAKTRKEFGPTSWMVFRFVVACCAADAQPLAVVADARRGQMEFPNDTWVMVQGIFEMRRYPRGDMVPFIDDAVMSLTSEPQPPFLY